MTITGAPRVQPHTQTQLAISIDRTPLGIADQERLLEVRVDLGVRTIGQARLTFVDRRGDGDLATRLLIIDKEVTISSVEPSAVVMTGTITAIEMDADRSGTTVTAVVQDDARKLARSRGIVAYEDQSYSDLITKLIKDCGFKADVPRLPERFPWLLQADTVLGLIDEVAGRFGLDWAAHRDTLALWSVSRTAPWASRQTLTLATELLTFSVRQVDHEPRSFTVRGWDSSGRRPAIATAQVRSTRDGFAPREGNNGDVLASNQVSATSEEVKAVAEGLAAAAGRVSGRGSAIFLPQLRPGGEVEIHGAGSADGLYYVREVTHRTDASSLRTEFVVGDRAPVQLSDPWRSPPRLSSLRRHGVTIGIVDNVNDPEELGRVRVSLAGMAEHTSSAWARVLSLGAGKGHGLVMLPEVDDEVLVAFEDDDVRRPVVLGGLFGAKTQVAGPAPVDSGRVESRHLMSRNGHRVAIADGGANGEFVQMALAGDAKRVHLGKDGTEIAADNTPLKISSGGASISFDGNGNITISAQSLTLSAQQTVKVEGMDIVEKASNGYEASGIRTTLNASATAVVKGAASAEISGAMVKIN
ncbi:phage baseplate assembly protein V [Pseudactinotalea sp.]|uniref:phage baseplate assembly protein V n=1 Tax=Pseudactinotalea sp. TaxID=1926260 RepID=UPI003B3AC8A2